jgi:uncharacterized protein YacL
MKLSWPKLALGLILFIIGFTSVDVLTRGINLFETHFFHRLLGGILLGGIGIFLFPIASRVLGRLIGEFTDHVAKQVVLRVESQIDKIKLQRQKSKNKKAMDKKQEYLLPIILDTSAIIDGRIWGIVRAGFLPGTMLIPWFVLTELQHIADSNNELRRQRGRRGLEILKEMKRYRSAYFRTVVLSPNTVKAKDVDGKLIELAKRYKGRIVTVDFNLNSVAKVSGVEVLNVNELVNIVKTTILPGESLTISVIQIGKDSTQGVGYLEDGTMVVVEGGADLVGQKAMVVVSRLLQTAAGKMIFAKKV